MNIVTVILAQVGRFFDSIRSPSALIEYYRRRVEYEIDEVMQLKMEIARLKQDLRTEWAHSENLERYITTLEHDNDENARAISTLKEEYATLQGWYRDLEEQFERLDELTIGYTYTYTESGFPYTGLVVRIEQVGNQIVRWVRAYHNGKVYTESQFKAMASREIREYLNAVRKKVGAQYQKVVESTSESGPQWEAAGKQAEEELAWLLAGTQGNWVHRN